MIVPVRHKGAGVMARNGSANGAVKTIFIVIWRAAVPAVTLSAAYLAAYGLSDEPIAVFDNQALLGQAGLHPSAWLGYGHLAIMLAFFAVMLTNRMFGPAYALLQTLLAWIIAGGVYLLGLPALNTALHHDAGLPGQPVFTLFLGALAAAHFVSILIFDSMRGPIWWRAPLLSGILAAICLSGIYWGVLRAPASAWVSRLSLDLALKVAVAVLLLAPYALLRPLTKPRDGFGGY
jgi:hypothetical protein